MANEYNELEQLVNDVTNIDTARMTLRWALERLNAIEKEKAELKKNLTITEDTKKGLELKVQSLEDTFKSRGKSLDEKEGFYNKLEATMSLLGDGKLDIQQLLKKEAKLDHLRLELENEYQDKFEELDKNQNSVIERWNARLLDVEGQYAKRLSEAQVRYDSLRHGLEADYQSRLGALNTSYQNKEKELTERIKALETSMKTGEGTLEVRRKELETEYFAKKDEVEGNYRKLKSALEENSEGRVRMIENDHAAQIKSLEQTWSAERERLQAEQHARDEQFSTAQLEMARLEAQLSEQQERHHSELLDIISKKEEAFRAKVDALEKEKTAYEAAVKKLMRRLEEKENEWLADKNRLQIEFSTRCAELESSVRERGEALENDYAARKEELKSETSARVESARRDMEEEKIRLAEDNRTRESELAEARAFIKNLEEALTDSGEAHHRELMDKIRNNEESFRAKLAEFETEKEEYKKVIAELVKESGHKDARLLEERTRLQNEFDQKYAALEAELSARDAKAAESKTGFEARLAVLAASFAEKEKKWVVEKEKLANELTENFNKALALKDELAEKYSRESAAREKRWAEEKESIFADFAVRSRLLEKSLAERETELENRYKMRTEELDKRASETRALLETDFAQKMAIEKAALEKTRAGLAEADKMKEEELSGSLQLAEERMQMIRAEYEERKAGLEEQYREQLAAASNALELERGAWRSQSERLEAMLAATVQDLKSVQDKTLGLSDALSLKEDEIGRLNSEMAEKVRQSTDALRRAQGETLAKKSAELEAAFNERKARFESEASALRGTLEKEYQSRREELAMDSESRTLPLRLENDALKKTVQKMRDEVASAASKAESYISEKIESAAAKATQLLQEKLHFMENEMGRMEQHGKNEKRVIEEDFNKERAALLEDAVRKNKYIEMADFKLREMEAELAKNRQNSAANLLEQDEVLKALVRDFELKREDLEKDGARAVEEKKARLENEAAALKETLEKEYWKRQEDLAKELESRTLPLKLENEGLKRTVEKMREEVAGAVAKAEAYVNEKVESASAKATLLLQDKLRFMENEFGRVGQYNMDERRLLEETFHKERERLMEDLNRKNKYIEVVDFKLQEMEADLMKNRQNSAANLLDQDEVFKALVRDFEVRQENLEREGARAIEEKKARLENEAAAVKAALEKEYWKRQEELCKDQEANTMPLRLENEGLRKTLEKLREEISGAAAKAEAYVNERIESAAANATQLLQKKVHFMETELSRMEQYNKDERRVVEETSHKERERMTGELARKNNYIEVVDAKLREMEDELLKIRQNSAVNFLGQIAEQDDQFKTMAGNYEARQDKLEMETTARVEEIRKDTEARLRDMDEMLKAKEKLLRESGEFWRQKEAELDAQNSELNLKMHRFNEDLFAQKQELSAKEKQLNECRLTLERDQAAKMGELEKLKVELTRAIMDYKNRK